MANENIVQYRVIHKKSNVKDKLPTPEQMLYGEIAINYAVSSETISIKNANDDIVTFPSSRITNQLDNKIDELSGSVIDNELVIAGVLNNMNESYNQLVTTVSGINTNVTTISGNVTTINTNITTISGDVTTISGNVTTISGDVTTISGDVTTISGNVTTISGNVTTNSTDISIISGIVGTLETAVSGISETLEEVRTDIDDMDLVIAAAINDLNDKIDSVLNEIVLLKQRVTILES